MPKLNHILPFYVNPTDKDWTKHRYVLWFGAYGSTRLIVSANSLDDAIEEASGWLADNEPGHFHTEYVNETYQECVGKGMSEEEAWEEATTDMTCLDQGRYLASWEWGIVAEDPSREDLGQIFPVS